MTVFGGDDVFAHDINDLHLRKRGRRDTNSSATNAGTGAEIGVLRLDDLGLKAGIAYEVRTGNLRVDLSVTTDRPKITLRHSTSGAATNSSDEIGRNEGATNPGDNNSFPPVVGWIFPATDQPNASVRLSISRPTGTGTVNLIADTGHGIQLYVIPHGTDPGDTGVDE